MIKIESTNDLTCIDIFNLTKRYIIESYLRLNDIESAKNSFNDFNKNNNFNEFFNNLCTILIRFYNGDDLVDLFKR